jgi:hypothetical protein
MSEQLTKAKELLADVFSLQQEFLGVATHHIDDKKAEEFIEAVVEIAVRRVQNQMFMCWQATERCIESSGEALCAYPGLSVPQDFRGHSHPWGFEALVLFMQDRFKGK